VIKRPHLFTAAVVVLTLALTGCAGNLECDRHPCVGNWKRDMALGGSVVHCPDGTWSHAGGLGNACSGHARKQAKQQRDP
jgi:hypothetical protein